MSADRDPMKVLVVNCGSSSIKYQLYDMPTRRVLARGIVERIGEPDAALQHQYEDRSLRLEGRLSGHEEGMALILETLTGSEGVLAELGEIGAVGHRVVHGGEEFTGSVLITENVIASIERFADLAPLHNPPNLTGIRAAMVELPGVPQVACFDTAFHATIPEVAYTYALPYELYEKHGIRRYGFHGTSHRYVARRAAQLLGVGKYDLNGITIHLGNGCSMAAVRGGRSVDTSMGLTPLEGLVMGTRTGDFDPAILFYLAERGYDVASLNTLCNKQSGLLGISGRSNDMRTLGRLAAEGDRRAALAIDVFAYRIKKYLGMYCAVLGRVDAFVFTGGIGENAVDIRAKACGGLEELGVVIDPERNRETVGRREGPISTADSRIQVLVVPTDEEAAIAADTYELTRELPRRRESGRQRPRGAVAETGRKA
jgi:acetate kinase